MAGDYPAALAAARQVLTALERNELRGYRAWWYYLAGSAAWLLAEAGDAAMGRVARGYFNSAAATAPAVRWLVALSTAAPPATGEVVPSPREVAAYALVERLERELERLGMGHDRRYDAEEAAIRDGLAQNASGPFEGAQVRLGRLLGFDAGNEESNAAPDPWWLVDQDLCLIFEDHSDADPASRLHVNKARQVASHPNWARARLHLAPNAAVVPLLVTPVLSADPEALPHLGEVCLWRLDDFRAWAAAALDTVRELRRTFPGSGDPEWRARAARLFVDRDLDPEGLVLQLRARPAATLLAPSS